MKKSLSRRYRLSATVWSIISEGFVNWKLFLGNKRIAETYVSKNRYAVTCVQRHLKEEEKFKFLKTGREKRVLKNKGNIGVGLFLLSCKLYGSN